MYKCIVLGYLVLYFPKSTIQLRCVFTLCTIPRFVSRRMIESVTLSFTCTILTTAVHVCKLYNGEVYIMCHCSASKVCWSQVCRVQEKKGCIFEFELEIEFELTLRHQYHYHSHP